MSEKIYRIPVYYNVCEYVCVKAENAEQAHDFAEDHKDLFSTHCGEAQYLDDSYEVESDIGVYSEYDTDDNRWTHGEAYQTLYDATTKE